MRTLRGFVLVLVALLALTAPAAAQQVQCLGVTPTSITASGPVDSVFTQTLTLLNFTSSNVYVLLTTSSGPCVVTATMPLAWASTSPITATLSDSGTQVVNVILDSTGLPAGTYTGTLCATSDGCSSSPVSVPLSMVITQRIREQIPVLSAAGLAGLALLLLAAGLFVLRTKL